MKQISAKVPRTIVRGSVIDVCDNSGAKKVFLISVKWLKTTKGRYPAAGIGDLINVSVIKGTPGVRKQVMPAVIVRQRKEFRRPDGTRIKFEDNAVVMCKDLKGNPKGTIIKGPIAKEVAERWIAIGKLASVMV